MLLSQVSGQINLEVRYTFKKVKSISHALQGTFSHEEGDVVTFELSVPIFSFKSGDKDFDQHLQSVVELASYPLAKASGHFPRAVLESSKSLIEAKIDFHGVCKSYSIQVEKFATRASFILDLDAHQISRPSLLGIKIKNEVNIECELKWS